MSNTKNLWPTELLSESDLVLPITILQEQAGFLNEMTKHVIVAEVNTRKIGISDGETKEGKLAILHNLKIIAPTLGNYDFDLVRLVQEDMLPYPVRCIAPLVDQQFMCESSEELQDILHNIFQETRVITTIQSLILQSKHS